MKCEYCENEFLKIKINQRFCCEKCRARASSKRCGEKWEKKQRDNLTNGWVKKCILIESKGKIKTKQITPEMIETKRKAILEFRFKRENHLLKKDSIIKGPYKCKCVVCGIDFLGKTRANNKCSDRCRYAQQLERSKGKYKEEWEKPNPFICKECGELHQPEFGDTTTVFCSDTCRKRNGRRVKHQGAWTYRRYKREKEGERFKVKEIYDRDRWLCGICHKKVNSRLKFPHPMSPSLDHIIPIALGGSHTKKNVQLAHLSCNVDAGIGGVKQFKMFG